MPNLLNRMQNNEGWLTYLSTGVESQFQIPLANHLHHKEKRRLFKTLAYILRIPVCEDDANELQGNRQRNIL